MIPSPLRTSALSLVTGLVLALAFSAPAADSPPPPPVLEDLHRLLSAEVPDLPPPEAGETNAAAYLRRLAPRVIPAEPPAPAEAPITRTNRYASEVAYVRIGRVAAGLDTQLAAVCRHWRESGGFSGLIVDLRFAAGSDFAAAAAAASVLATRSSPPLTLGDQSLPVEPRDAARSGPVAVLVNHATRGAAEALAAALRAATVPCLILGTNTAGLARAYRSLELPGLGPVQIATASLVLGDGQTLGPEGLAPDIIVPVTPEADHAYFLDEFYRRVPDRSRIPAETVLRLNEAELVRRRRGIRGPATPAVPERPPTIQDPVLARAHDILDGLRQVREAGATGLPR